METNSRPTAVRTLSKTVEYNNSHNESSPLSLSASVHFEGGRVTSINNGQMALRNGGGNIGTFHQNAEQSFEFHVYSRVEGMTNAEIVTEVEAFLSELRAYATAEE